MSHSSKKYLALLLVFSCVAVLLAETKIIEFKVAREGSKAILEWVTERETNLDKFLVLRSTDNTNWTTLGAVKALQGDSFTKRNYKYEDSSIYKANFSTFYYRLQMVDKNGNKVNYDNIVSLSGSSGIKHTWGSIKAMFR